MVPVSMPANVAAKTAVFELQKLSETSPFVHASISCNIALPRYRLLQSGQHILIHLQALLPGQ